MPTGLFEKHVRPERFNVDLIPLASCLMLGLFFMKHASSQTPPETDQEPFSYSLHGELIEDPYHWLEGSQAPEAAGDDRMLEGRVSDWTDAQNTYTRSRLDALGGRETLESELSSLLSLDSYGMPRVAGDWFFYTLRRGDQAQPVLYVQRGETGEPRALLNVNELDESGLLALAWYRPSPDGELVAFGTYSAGDEQTTAFLLETATGEWLGDKIDGRVGAVDWFDDGERFIVRRLSTPDNPYSGQITLHRIGRESSDDPVLFEQYTEGELATTWGPYPIVSGDGRWLIIVYFTGTDSNDVWFYDLENWRQTGSLVRQDLLVGKDARTMGFIEEGTFYAETTLGASNKRVLAFDLNSENPSVYREVVPVRENAVITGISSAPGRIVIEYLANAYSSIEVFDLVGQHLMQVSLPEIGSASMLTNPDSDIAWFRFESFADPESIYRVDLNDGSTTLWRRPQPLIDTGDLLVNQVFFTSQDGTQIPMFLIHQRNMVMDGENPTVLYGYGGFDISLTPSFIAGWMPWLARGGVYAVANLRGGGEFGADWHRAGMLEKKQNVFDDFYAAAEWLFDNGYTRAERLGIRGGSNGGLLTGVAITQRPDLFSAAIVAVPLLDMLRYQHFLMARYWVPEYGSSEILEQFDYIRAYSPYHNIRSGVRYPATLLTAGENDTRVHPLHARKMAAALQAATGGNSEEEPILLWVDRSAGHGQGKPLAQRVEETADQVAFMGWQLGLR
jgi:prolyl oligopeptidase